MTGRPTKYTEAMLNTAHEYLCSNVFSDIPEEGSSSVKRLVKVLNNYNPIPESGCWIWMGGVNPKGYGQVTISGKKILIHRLSLMDNFIEKGMIEHALLIEIGAGIVRHKCDIPCCMNPEHLEIGTQADNMEDMRLRGRAGWQK